jgi:hypothetical protein
MKTVYKVLIAATIGLAVMWLSYQVLHLEQVTTTVVSIIVTTAAFAVCNKIKQKK